MTATAHMQTITPAAVRAEQVRLWGEAKVAANEADIARRFAHLGGAFIASLSR